MTDTLATGANSSTAGNANNSAAGGNNTAGAGAGGNGGAGANGANNDAGANAAGNNGGANDAGANGGGANAADGNNGANNAGANAAPADIKYELKLPDGSKLGAAFVERTAAIARELGLDQKGAEKLLTTRAQEHTDALAYMAPPNDKGDGAGPGWIARDAQYRKDALADRTLAPDGTQATLDITIEKAQQGLKVLDAGGKLTPLLRETGWGSHPVVLAALADLGRRAGEGTQIRGDTAGTARKKSDAEVMFPNMFNDDGTPKK
jgi:hypothetical protein